MNFARTIGAVIAAICLVAAIVVLVSEQIASGQLISHALALVTCLAGAAVFFISPYAIIPGSGKTGPESARTRNVMQLVMAGCYSAVLLMIIWLGYPIFTETNSGRAILTGSETAGLSVLVSAFVFSLACHMTATLAAIMRLISQPS